MQTFNRSLVERVIVISMPQQRFLCAIEPSRLPTSSYFISLYFYFFYCWFYINLSFFCVISTTKKKGHWMDQNRGRDESREIQLAFIGVRQYDSRRGTGVWEILFHINGECFLWFSCWLLFSDLPRWMFKII